jgi:hypothetical protein
MIKTGFSRHPRRVPSFRDVLKTLKRHNFAIVSGVDSAEVLAFVGWVEFLEQFRE